MLQMPTVHILLGTYNGARYLSDQLESIARQTYKFWKLTVSDDGSSDDTLDIVRRFALRVTQPVALMQGPMQGSSTANFWHLVTHSPASNLNDLYAYCDQDDIWHDVKLMRAVNWHSQHVSQSPRLYCARTQFVNERLQPIGYSPSIKRSPSFSNALVQNIASGNTMVFNYAVLIAQKKIKPSHVVWHDWTTYIVVTALDGLVYFDNSPCLFYRQHDANVVGSNNSFRQLLNGITHTIRGRYRYRIDMNLLALVDLGVHNTQHVLESTSIIKLIRLTKNPFRRLMLIVCSNIRRQSTLSSIGLITATLMGKL